MPKRTEDKPRVMIVDDVVENLQILIENLKDDYHLIPLKSAETALLKLAEDPLPDLVLLDIVMPDMDGYELCERLKADPRTKDIPVIFITAVSEVMDDAKAFELGAVDYVPKPFNPLTVKARVSTHIKLHHTVRELQLALKDIRTLSGFIPICAKCKKIRDDKGFWNQVEKYIQERSDAQFSHGICPECVESLYPMISQQTGKDKKS